MTDHPTKLPALPDPANTQAFLQAVKEIIEVRGGVRGSNPLDQYVTLRDLIGSGVMSFLKNGVAYSKESVNSGASGATSGGTTYTGDGSTDYTIPPAITGLIAVSAMNSIILSWDRPTQYNYAYTETWRSATDNIGEAVLLGTSVAPIYADLIGSTGQAFYYWVRAVSTADIKGPFNDTAGTSASTSLSVADVVGILAGQISASELNASLNSRINLIDAPTTGLVDQVSSLNGDVSTLQTSVAELQNTPAFDPNITYAVGDLVTYSGSLYRCAQAITTTPAPDPTNTTYWTKIGDYSSLSGAVAGNATAITALQTRSTTDEGNITNNSSAITALQNTVNDPNSGVTANASAISSLDSRVTTNDGSLTSQATDITRLQSQIGAGSNNLIPNGDAETGDNTDFSQFTYANSGSYKGQGHFVASTQSWRTNDDLIPVDVSKQYELEAAFKTDLPDTIIWGGVECYNQQAQRIAYYMCWRFAGADTTLYAAANAGDTYIDIVPPSGGNWQTIIYPAVHLNAQSDYSDLPNMDAIKMAYDANKYGQIDTSAGSYWRVTLQSPLAQSYASGTPVGISEDGSTYNYVLVGNTAVGTSWVLKSATLQGENGATTPPTTSAGVFWRGTYYIKFVCYLNYSQADTGHLDAVALRQVSNQGTANASAISSLNTQVSTNQGNISANASDISTLQTNVGGNSVAIQEEKTVRAQALAPDWSATASYNVGDTVVYTDGNTYRAVNNTGPGWTAADWALASSLYGQWTVKIDANGKVVGIGLSNDGPGNASDILEVVADKFAIVKPDGTGQKIPFIVDTSTGQVLMDTALIGTAKISDAQVASLAATKLFAASGTIAAAIIGAGEITNAMIDNIIKSSNYVAGSTGWQLDKTGTLNAYAGNFGGALQAATGSFAGSLTAATGTFSGSMTAAAVNAVDTINLAGNAVTIPSSAYTASPIIVSTTTSTWTTVQSISFTVPANGGGQPVAIIFSAQVYATDIHDATVTYDVSVRLLEDGTSVYSQTITCPPASGGTGTVYYSVTLNRSPAVGAHTYELQMMSTAGAASSSNSSMITLLAMR